MQQRILELLLRLLRRDCGRAGRRLSASLDGPAIRARQVKISAGLASIRICGALPASNSSPVAMVAWVVEVPVSASSLSRKISPRA